MRKIYLVLALIFAMCNLAQAQKHNIKLDLTSYAIWNEARVHYEFNFAKRSSVTIMAGVIIPKNSNISILFNPTELEQEYGADFDFNSSRSGFTLGAQYRYYLTKSDFPKGLYINPFLKFNRFNYNTHTSINVEISPSQFAELSEIEQQHANINNSGNYDFHTYGNFDFSLKRWGIGMGLGYQWVIANRITIDYTFIGFGIDALTFNGEFKVKEGTTDINYTEWADDIKDHEILSINIGDSFETTVEPDRVKIKFPAIIPTPYTSLSIGYCF